MNTKKKSRKFIRQNYNFNSQDIINDPKKSILIDAMNIANIRNNDNKAHLQTVQCAEIKKQHKDTMQKSASLAFVKENSWIYIF